MALAGLLALTAGAVLLAGGLARFGFVMDFLSQPVRLGYLNGVALTVIVSQLPKLFGFAVDADGLVEGFSAFVEGVGDGRVGAAAATIGVGSLVVILALRRVAPRVPGLLVAVGGATLAVWWLRLDSVPVVGALPQGLPAPPGGPLVGRRRCAPARRRRDRPGGLRRHRVLSRTLGAREGDRPDASHEMAALGFTNLACGALGGFPVSGSSSRTPVAREAPPAPS